MMIELMGRGFALLAAVLSFIAGNRDPRGSSDDGIKPHWMLLQRVEISLRGLQVGSFKALAEAIVN